MSETPWTKYEYDLDKLLREDRIELEKARMHANKVISPRFVKEPGLIDEVCSVALKRLLSCLPGKVAQGRVTTKTIGGFLTNFFNNVAKERRRVSTERAVRDARVAQNKQQGGVTEWLKHVLRCPARIARLIFWVPEAYSDINYAKPIAMMAAAAKASVESLYDQDMISKLPFDRHPHVIITLPEGTENPLDVVMATLKECERMFGSEPTAVSHTFPNGVKLEVSTTGKTLFDMQGIPEIWMDLDPEMHAYWSDYGKVRRKSHQRSDRLSHNSDDVGEDRNGAASPDEDAASVNDCIADDDREPASPDAERAPMSSYGAGDDSRQADASNKEIDKTDELAKPLVPGLWEIAWKSCKARLITEVKKLNITQQHNLVKHGQKAYFRKRMELSQSFDPKKQYLKTQLKNRIGGEDPHEPFKKRRRKKQKT